MPHLVIAIDGPAASGKGTLARRLAERLGYAYLDTGKLYRAVAWQVMQRGVDVNDEAAVVAVAGALGSTIGLKDLQDPVLSQDDVGSNASRVAHYAGVRQALNKFQKDFAACPPASDTGGAYGGAVLDGRDIGTVICPDADIKFYITASTEVRAQRRAAELESKNLPADYPAILADMRERDERDSRRSNAPLVAAPDAIFIDTSSMTAAEVLDQVLSQVRGMIVEKLAMQG